MTKGKKVSTETPPSSDSEEPSPKENMIKQFGLNGYHVIKKLMKKLEKREMSLEKQEDLLVLEKERKLALEVSLAEENEKVEELTRELSLAKDSIEEKDVDLAKANSFIDGLKSANETLQKNFSCLEVRYKDLEVQFNTLLETTSSPPKANLDSNVSTSQGCKICYNHDMDICATNLAKLGELGGQAP